MSTVGVLLESIARWPVVERESNAEWRREAMKLKASGCRSVADAWIAGRALRQNGELVHKDPESDGLLSLEALKLP